MSSPSQQALDAAWGAFPGDDLDTARGVLLAAHDPALGLDRSVCLRDLVEAFRVYGYGLNDPAAFIVREFGGGS